MAVSTRREGSGRQLEPDHRREDLKALRIPKTGQTYELGHIYEPSMPQYGNRPYYPHRQPAPAPQKEGEGFGHQDYFNGFIGQMGTQFDALGHRGGSCGWRTGR